MIQEFVQIYSVRVFWQQNQSGGRADFSVPPKNVYESESIFVLIVFVTALVFVTVFVIVFVAVGVGLQHNQSGG